MKFVVTYTGDMEDQNRTSITTVSKRSGMGFRQLSRKTAGEFEVISFWGILLLICGGLLIFRPLITPGWLDSMVLSDMLLHGWIGDNPRLSDQFVTLQAVEPGQLPYLILAGIDAALGPLVAPVVAAVLSLVLFTLALHALVNSSRPRRTTPSWPLSIVALVLFSGLALHRYPPGILFGLTFGLTALAVWRHRFSSPDIVGVLLLILALTMTLGMDFQIFLGTLAVLVLMALTDGMKDVRRAGARNALVSVALRFLMLLVALIPSALMLAYFARLHDPDWGAVFSAVSPGQPFSSAVQTYVDALMAFPQAAEYWFILGLGLVTGLTLLAGVIFRPFRGRVDRADILLIAGIILVSLALSVFRGSLLGATGPLTGAKAFWLGLVLLIAWAALSPMAPIIRQGLMAACVVLAAGLTGNRILTYEHLAQQSKTVGIVSGLVKKGSSVVDLDFTEGRVAHRAAGLSILQQSAIGMNISALSDSPAVRLMEMNPPLQSQPDRGLAQIIGADLMNNPSSVRLAEFSKATGKMVGSLFVMGAPPSSPAGEKFAEYLKEVYEPVYRFTSGSLQGLTLYQPRPPNDVRP